MDSKIPAHFWGGDTLTSPELLLAALWLRSHSGINLAGYAEISVRRFCFDTHLPPEALDRVAEALGKGLVRHGNEYWLRDFIADEFGRGAALMSNNMSAAVVKDLGGVRSPWVALEVLKEYPELEYRWQRYRHQALGKPLPRSTQVQGEGEGEGEGEGVRAGVGAGGGIGVQGKGSRRSAPRPKAKAVPAAAMPEAAAARVLEINALFGRRASTAWSPKEQAALVAQGLLELPAEEWSPQIDPLRAVYAELPLPVLREAWGLPADDTRDFRRRDLLTLLNNWAGEVDRARKVVDFVAKKSAEERRLRGE